MRPDARAVVFDLDDTIYPYRRFVRSGFAAVARHLASAHGLDPREVFRTLVRASRAGDRGAELQACLCTYALDLTLLPDVIALFRQHEPALTLPRQVATVLSGLRAEGWRLGVLTNGWPDVQARKITALGLRPYVDAVVFATEHGPGKPHPGGFVEVLRQLDVPAHAAVFIGDDEVCDMTGAIAAGLTPIRCTRWHRPLQRSVALATVSRWPHVPALVRDVFQEVTSRHAA